MRTQVTQIQPPGWEVIEMACNELKQVQSKLSLLDLKKARLERTKNQSEDFHLELLKIKFLDVERCELQTRKNKLQGMIPFYTGV